MARVESLLPDPAGGEDAGTLADWAEATLLIEDRRRLSRAAIRQRLVGASGDDGGELLLDLLLAEVQRRERLAPAAYPYTSDGTSIERRAGIEARPYHFILLLAASPNFRNANDAFDEPVELFDYLVVQALRSYLGPSAVAIRFGHPSRDGRPPSFPDAVGWLADQMNLGRGPSEPSWRRRDGGLDVAAWRPFMDERSGFIAILCQCTIAKKWVRKALDLPYFLWPGWIDFGIPPATALAIPFAVPAGFDQWDELRRTVTLVLDRFRLLECIDPAAVTDLPAIGAWIDSERGTLGRVAS